MRKIYRLLLEYGLLIIITIPAFASLLNPYFFSMHDSQQVARLYVLVEGLKQGSIYPRWVDLFGFNYGYPLFNFYPPLIYFVGALFHALGFSFLWSVKMVFISGYILSAIGIYLLVKTLLRHRERSEAISYPGYLAAVLYTFFTYHAINAYVRGAMAEFFSMAVLPFVFLSLEQLRQKTTLRNAFFLSITFALLMLTHPLIAFPAVLFIGAYILYGLVLHKEKLKYMMHAAVGGIGGLLLSAFFWLPSMIERRFTLVDSILLKELASWSIHFIQPDQLWFSPWGYGGSGPGYSDGMSFQLGKVHIGIALLSLIACLYALIFFRKKAREHVNWIFSDFGFYFTFMLGAIFMTLEFSKPLWELISFLQYLQFPWRFLTFVGIFISVVGAYGVYFAAILFEKIPLAKPAKSRSHETVIILLVLTLSALTIGTYQKYFKPQDYVKVTDAQLTSFDEIAWRVSRTSFEFVPKGVTTKKSDLGTTILDIDREDLNRSVFDITGGTATVNTVTNTYSTKTFDINSLSGVIFKLHTYNFPGWTATLDGSPTAVSDRNPHKLMMVAVPAGQHQLRFVFKDTPVRTVGNILSIISAALIGVYLAIMIYLRKVGK